MARDAILRSLVPLAPGLYYLLKCGSDAQNLVGTCADKLCRNGASCRDIETDDGEHRYVCFCTSGWAGAHCDIFDSCAGHDCANQALCIPTFLIDNTITNSRGEGYICDCRPGWAGEFCTENVDPCSPNPCWENAPCSAVDYERMTYSCTCPPYRVGDGYDAECNARPSPCVPNPCGNPDRTPCVVTNYDLMTYRCLCELDRSGPGFTEDCFAKPSPCEPNPCFDQVRCSVVDYDQMIFSCDCGTVARNGPKFDRSCNIKPNPCDDDPCPEHANCRIIDWDAMTYWCPCPGERIGPQFYPTDCELKPSPCDPNPCLNGTECAVVDYEKMAYMCKCPPLLRGNNFDGTCRERPNPCDPNICWNNTDCTVLSYERMVYTCACPEDRIGFGFDDKCYNIFIECPEKFNKTIVFSDGYTLATRRASILFGVLALAWPLLVYYVIRPCIMYLADKSIDCMSHIEKQKKILMITPLDNA